MAAEDFPVIHSDDTISGTGNDPLNGLDGNQLTLNGFTSATINDTNNSGATGDADTDDSTVAGNESWIINGNQKSLSEIAVYDNNTLYLKNGDAVQFDVVLLLYEDGTYAITAKDALNGMNNDINGINPNDIDYTRGITLGTQRNEEFQTIDSFQNYRDFFVCFTTGTLIETANGQTPVEDLKVGDAVRTLDNGYQKILWIGSKEITGDALARNSKLLPVRIKAGALGQALPERDLIVSRQHRVLVRSDIALQMFGTKEILVPAIKLVGYPGIEIAKEINNVTYWHILFDKHEVIFSEGVPSESLFTGPVALKNVSPEARQELEMLFPHLMEQDFISVPARHMPKKGVDIRKLVAQHTNDNQPLLC